MPVYKCPNGKYRIGSGKCMYGTKAKALRAYAAYRAISHTSAFMIYLRFVVERARRALADDTTTKDIARRIVVNVRRRIKKKKEGEK